MSMIISRSEEIGQKTKIYDRPSRGLKQMSDGGLAARGHTASYLLKEVEAGLDRPASTPTENYFK